MHSVNPQKFSLAVSGQGDLMSEFVGALRQRYPRVVIYDRNEEASRPPSTAPIPRHPEVADIDAVFVRKGSVETASIRSRRNHRFFNYDPAALETNQTHKGLLMKQMVQTVADLLSEPVTPVQTQAAEDIDGTPQPE